MNNVLKETVQNLLPVTIAFTLGGAVIAASLYGLYVFGIGLEPGQGINDWFRTGVLTVGLSAMAGLMIDAFRLAATLVWGSKPEHRHSIREIVQHDLA